METGQATTLVELADFLSAPRLFRDRNGTQAIADTNRLPPMQCRLPARLYI